MPVRSYTTKGRAKRIALDYFKWPHPFRRARFFISAGLAVVAAVAVIVYAVRGDYRLYTSGPVSTAHAMFVMNDTAYGLTAGVYTRPAFVFRGSDFWAHGANVGLEFRY